MPQHQLVQHLQPEVGRQVGLAPAVEGQGYAQSLDLRPQRVVGLVVPRPPVHRGRREKDGLETELLHAASGLGDRAGHVMRRHHAGAVHAVRRVVAEVLQPVVVGARDGGGELGLQSVGADLFGRVQSEHEQPA